MRDKLTQFWENALTREVMGKRRYNLLGVMLAEYPVWALVLFIVSLACVFSFVAGMADLFARLGAAVVAVIVMFSATKIRAIQFEHSERIDETNQEVAVLRAQGFVANVLGTRPQDFQRVTFRARTNYPTVQQLHQESAKLIRPFLILEMVVVLLGTLQWSFGDWAVNLFINCGEIEC